MPASAADRNRLPNTPRGISAGAAAALRRQRPALILTVIAYAVIAVLYVTATPLQSISLPDNLPQNAPSQSLLVGNGPDEKEYLVYILSLAKRGVLPAPSPALRTSPADYVSYQVQHPPLFFALDAVLYRLVSSPLGPAGFWYLLRGLCALCGGIVVVLASRAAAIAFPDEPLIVFGAPPALALLPTFAHLCGNLSNEPLALVFDSLAWLRLVQIVRRPGGAAPTRRDALLTGLWLALGVATRLTTVIYLPAALAVFLCLRGANTLKRTAFLRALLCLLPATIVIAAWLLHNRLAYGLAFPRPFDRPMLPQGSLMAYLANPVQPLNLNGLPGQMTIGPKDILITYASRSWVPFWLVLKYLPGGVLGMIAFQVLSLLAFVALAALLLLHALRSRRLVGDTPLAAADPAGRLLLWMAGLTIIAVLLGALEQQFFADWTVFNSVGRYLVAAAPAAVPFYLYALASRFHDRPRAQAVLSAVLAVGMGFLAVDTVLLVRQFYTDHPDQPSVQRVA